jgi:hypothetical protein
MAARACAHVRKACLAAPLWPSSPLSRPPPAYSATQRLFSPRLPSPHRLTAQAAAPAPQPRPALPPPTAASRLRSVRPRLTRSPWEWERTYFYFYFYFLTRARARRCMAGSAADRPSTALDVLLPCPFRAVPRPLLPCPPQPWAVCSPPAPTPLRITYCWWVPAISSSRAPHARHI